MSFPRYPSYKNSGVPWLGEVPEHWEVVQFKQFVDIHNGADHKHVELAEGYPVLGSGGIFTYASEFLYDGESVLLGRKGTIDKPLHVTGRFWTVDTMYWTKIRSDVCGRFAYYAALTIPFGYYSTNTALPSMTKGALNSHLLARPPLAEQTQIADFLDQETAKIDELVAEQQRLIGLLKEKRQAVVSHAVTKGTNPDSPTKPSGIEWLGDVPEHWGMVRLRGLFRQVKRQGQFGKQVLSVYRDYGVIPKDSRDDNNNKTPDDLSAYQLVNPGDLVVNKMKAWQGSLGVSDLEGITSPDYIVFAPRHPQCSSFVHWLLRSQRMVSVYRSISNGIRPAQWRLEPDSFLNLRIPLPPKKEQSELVSYIVDQTSSFDALVAESGRAIDLLQERRSALISAAVTGQIDVRAFAEREVA